MYFSLIKQWFKICFLELFSLQWQYFQIIMKYSVPFKEYSMVTQLSVFKRESPFFIVNYSTDNFF